MKDDDNEVAYAADSKTSLSFQQLTEEDDFDPIPSFR